MIEQINKKLIKKPKKKSWLQKKLNWLDDSILKPLFGGDLSRIKAHKEENRLEEEYEKMNKSKKDLKKNRSDLAPAINNSDGTKEPSEENKASKFKEPENNQKVAAIMQQTKLTSIAEDEEDN